MDTPGAEAAPSLSLLAADASLAAAVERPAMLSGPPAPAPRVLQGVNHTPPPPLLLRPLPLPSPSLPSLSVAWSGRM